jgi:hypothetical protein
VARELVVVTLVILLLVLAAEACGAPAPELAPDSPAAEATNVRRTVVAAAQRIIANQPSATPFPSATATPLPSCQNAIWWTEARSHVGESRTVQGIIVGSRSAPGGAALLEMGQPYPDPTGLAILSPAPATTDLSGKTICVAGRILLAEGRPTLQVGDLTQIQVLQ